MKKAKESRVLGTTYGRLREIEKEIANISAARDELKAHWQQEKELISSIRKMKGDMENLKLEAENYERQGELGKVAEIRYGKVIELEKELDNKSLGSREHAVHAEQPTLGVLVITPTP